MRYSRCRLDSEIWGNSSDVGHDFGFFFLLFDSIITDGQLDGWSDGPTDKLKAEKNISR